MDNDATKKSHADSAWLFSLAVAFVAIFLAPILKTPYISDDTYNFYLDGWRGYNHLSFFEGVSQLFWAQRTGGGRFYPGFDLLLFSEWHFVHSVVVMKTLVLLAVLANAVTLYVLLRLLVPAIALPTLVLVPLTLQFRHASDAITQFSLHMQVAWEFVLLGFLGLALFARLGRWRYLVLGTVAYAVACLTYEPMYAFALVYAVLAIALVAKGKRVAAIAAFAAPPAICTTIVLIFRFLQPLAPGNIYAVHAAVGPALRTLWIQALGALPLSYRIFNPQDPFAHEPGWNWWTWAITLFACAAIVGAYTFWTRSDRRPAKNDEERRVVVAGAVALCGWIVSGLFVAVSAKWQTSLTPGLAYTPVYFAAAFVAVLIASVGYVVVRRLPNVVGVTAVALAGAIAIGLTYQANSYMVALYAPWNMTLPQAMGAGLLGDAPDNATVFLDDSYPAQTFFGPGTWNVTNYLYYFTKKRLVAMPIGALPSRPPAHSFAVVGKTRDLDEGAAVAGEIAGVANVAGKVEPTFLSAERFVRAPGSPGVLTRWVSHCGPVVAQSILDGVNSALVLTYRGAFYPQELDGQTPFRWADGSGALRLENVSAHARTARMRFVLRPIDGGAHVRVTGPGVLTRAGSPAGDVAVDVKLRVPPHRATTIAILASGTPEVRPPDTRSLLFEVRNVQLDEPACGSAP